MSIDDDSYDDIHDFFSGLFRNIFGREVPDTDAVNGEANPDAEELPPDDGRSPRDQLPSRVYGVSFSYDSDTGKPEVQAWGNVSEDELRQLAEKMMSRFHGGQRIPHFGRLADHEPKLLMPDGQTVEPGVGPLPEAPEAPLTESTGDHPKTSTVEVIEPFTDVMRDPHTGDVRVTVELPGVRRDQVRLVVSGSTLTITARTSGRLYEKKVDLPFSPGPDPVDLHVSMQHGIAEIVIPGSPGAGSPPENPDNNDKV